VKDKSGVERLSPLFYVSPGRSIFAEFQRGRKQSEETKRRRSLAMMGNKNSLGYKHDPVRWAEAHPSRKGRKLRPHVKLGRRQSYVFISPNKDVFVVQGLEQFCIANGLHCGAMSSLARGKVKSHKGWRSYAAFGCD
jgi:hypothetical protein